MGKKYLEPKLEPVKKGPPLQHWIHHGSSLDQSNATFKDKLNTWLKIDKINHHLRHEVLRLHELGPHAVHHGLYRGHLLELCHELLRIGRMIVLPF